MKTAFSALIAALFSLGLVAAQAAEPATNPTEAAVAPAKPVHATHKKVAHKKVHKKAAPAN